ncbi:unnamed protein product [Didymodactylos carnosus]|uniref:Potassium channel domain-containing protein n=1 Tax=Didymodactylos carnosus TaxID=1234261 RepID=A0A815AHB6_9BILA|nr:unnamed protein product [Didymodactylos carnosus]CAF4028625.1 unnamed protein product [Didymodactylos carnosus]
MESASKTVSENVVGYGDVYPNTDGGRIVSGIVGLWGIISIALVIAIIQQYLQMNGAQQYVFEYNTLLEMNRERKYYIGNLIKFTVKAWYLRLNGNDKGQEYRQVQRKVHLAIDKIRNLRRQQLQDIVEDENTDKSNEQQMNPQIVEGIQNRLNQLDTKLDRLTQLMYDQMNINTQQNILSITERL